MLASNNKRILRNTGMLYLRMLLAMAVSLYTSRVVLNVLEIEDFGIYHAVVAVAALLGFMQGAMTTATQRFLAFDLGDNRGKNLQPLFNTSIQIHLLMASGIVIAAETAGYWLVSTHLTIPPERLSTALWAYHLSIATLAVSVLTVPFTAMLMANERMGLFALMSIVDVFLKLAAVLMLPYLEHDKLSAYAALLLSVSIITLTGYFLLNLKIFPTIRLKWAANTEYLKKMLSFTAWNIWGTLAASLSGHGNNILLNIFFGPAINASKNIADQASGAINSFILNIQAAVNPQIIKLYASGASEQMDALVQNASKYNFLLLLILATPIVFHSHQLLEAWLTNPPAEAATFLKLIIISSLIDSLSLPLMTSAQATGRIRLYQMLVGGILLLNVPISYVALTIWPSPTIVIWCTIALAITAFIARLSILKQLTGMAVFRYTTAVIPRVTLAAGITWLGCDTILPEIANEHLIISLAISTAIAIIITYGVGLNQQERTHINRLIVQARNII